VFSLNNTTFDVFLIAVFGVLGYIFRKLDAEPAPLLLAFILGPMMEEFLRRAMLISKGDPTVLVTRPISAVMLLFAAGLLAIVLSPTVSKRRDAGTGGGSSRPWKWKRAYHHEAWLSLSQRLDLSSAAFEIMEGGQVCISIRRQRLRRAMWFLSDQGGPFCSKMA
jgi:hypothetical protein